MRSTGQDGEVEDHPNLASDFQGIILEGKSGLGKDDRRKRTNRDLRTVTSWLLTSREKKDDDDSTLLILGMGHHGILGAQDSFLFSCFVGI